MHKPCPLKWARRITTACDRLASAEECHAAAEHTRAACKWSAEVRAVHFKGAIKPWLGRVIRAGTCEIIHSGAMTLMRASPPPPPPPMSTLHVRDVLEGPQRARSVRAAIDPADPVSWDPVKQQCLSGLVDGAIVH